MVSPTHCRWLSSENLIAFPVRVLTSLFNWIATRIFKKKRVYVSLKSCLAELLFTDTAQVDTSSPICYLSIYSTSKLYIESPSIFHWFRKANPRGKSTWHQFDMDNSTLVRLLKSMRYGWILNKVFSMSFWCWIDVTSKLPVTLVPASIRCCCKYLL